MKKKNFRNLSSHTATFLIISLLLGNLNVPIVLALDNEADETPEMVSEPIPADTATPASDEEPEESNSSINEQIDATESEEEAPAISDESEETITEENPENAEVPAEEEVSPEEPEAVVPEPEPEAKEDLGPLLPAEGKGYVEGEILIKYEDAKIDLSTSTGLAKAKNFATSKSLKKKENLEESNISILEIKDNTTVKQKVAELKKDPNVEYVEPNYVRNIAAIATNDTSRGQLWGLDNTGQSVNGISGTNDADVDAPEAWSINEGTNASVVVAIVDTGVAYNHPDLVNNMWDGSSCKDEEGNILGGCNHGYDFEDDDLTPLPTYSSHGTHVAGTIAAVKGNSTGIIGLAPHAKIMALKFGLDVASEIQAIDFAIENGAKVINASYGGGGFSQLEYDAIERFKDAGGIFVAAAGNWASDNDEYANYPSDYDLDNIIAVAATDQNDDLAYFSNYGENSIDVAAPGVNIYSTIADSLLSNETFETLTPPAVPVGWVKTGTSNNWRTYLTDGKKVLYGDLSLPYANNANTTISSTAYDLSGTGDASVNFLATCDTQYSTTVWIDYMMLEVSGDGGVHFTQLLRWDEEIIDEYNGEDPLDGTGSASTYLESGIPSEFLTSNFKLRFSWVTNGSDNAYNGCYIDDLKINTLGDGSGESYDYYDGTSMATPHVVGLTALIEGYNNHLTAAQVKNIILTSGDSLSALDGKTVSGKRINAQKALQAAGISKKITEFTVPGQQGVATVNETEHTVLVHVPFGTDVSTLAPTISISGQSISPVSGATQDFSSPITYTVTALDNSTQTYTIAVNILSSLQTTPDESGEAVLDATTTELVLTNIDQHATVTIAGDAVDPRINVSAFISGGSGILPAITIISENANNTVVSIPASTLITSEDADWDGIILPPANTTVTLPKTSGKKKTLSLAIELGDQDANLSFDQAVRILMTDQAEKKAGYVRPGINFTTISEICSEDNQDIEDELEADGECKIDVDSDMAIWTKHFTTFATYSQSNHNSGGGGGGGGGGSSSRSAPKTSAKKGDANKDGKIDKYDFALIMSSWGKTGTNAADFNADSKVDKYDFALLMSNWGL